MSLFKTAHKLGKGTRPRTVDVLTPANEDKDFDYLQLPPRVLAGLKNAGFEKPSPIQLEAIPLGKIGLDLVIQAKAGTGKTAVYVTIALCMIDPSNSSLQAVVLAPTREIAVQGARTALEIGSATPDLKVNAFIGGLSVEDDKLKSKKCHLAIGTPGRVRQLLEEGHMNTESVRLFILDEADKLLSESSLKSDVVRIYNRLPKTKQVLALSATYPESLADLLGTFMKSPTHVRPGKRSQVLEGLRQFALPIPAHPVRAGQVELKFKGLVTALTTISFGQCLVFCNYSVRAQGLCDRLNDHGWPAIFLAGSQEQKVRLQALNALKTFACRIVLTTDLTARGIDAANVDLIINFDLPRCFDTYLHRIGRAGRFGSYGLAVSLTVENEFDHLRKIVFSTGSRIWILPREGLEKLNLWKCPLDFEIVKPLETCENDDGEEEFVEKEKEEPPKSNGKKKAKRSRSKKTKKKSIKETEQLSLSAEEHPEEILRNILRPKGVPMENTLSLEEITRKIEHEEAIEINETLRKNLSEEELKLAENAINLILTRNSSSWRTILNETLDKVQNLSIAQISEHLSQGSELPAVVVTKVESEEDFKENLNSASDLSEEKSSSESEDSVESNSELKSEFPFPFPNPDGSSRLRGYPANWKSWFDTWYAQVQRNRDFIQYAEYYKRLYQTE